MVYKESEVVPGAILKIEIEGVFDGYVRLLEPAGQQLSEMFSDHSQVVVSQRWHVEFVPLEEVKMRLSNKNRLTQINQKCRRTHRNIKFVAGNFYDCHTRFSGIGESYPEVEGEDPRLDDFKGLF